MKIKTQLVEAKARVVGEEKDKSKVEVEAKQKAKVESKA